MPEIPVKRFCVQVDGHVTKLVSIRELKNGDLIIHDERGPIVSGTGSEAVLLNDQKFSVHRPLLKPNDTMIKMTAHVSERTKEHTAVSWVHNSVGNLLFPIHGRRPPFPVDADRYIEASPDEFHIFIATYDPHQWTLMYSVFVTYPGLNMNFTGQSVGIIDSDKSWCLAYKFSCGRYNVYLLPSWINTPTFRHGFTRPLYTSTPRINNLPMEVDIKQYRISVPQSEWVDHHHQVLSFLSDDLVGKIIDEAPDLIEHKVEIDQTARTYYKLPTTDPVRITRPLNGCKRPG